MRHGQRRAVSLVSQVDYNKVTEIFKKAARYEFLVICVGIKKCIRC